MPMPEAAIKCLIVDDEPPARDILRRYVAEIPSLQLVGECSNAIQAFTFLREKSVDLVFLDIRMPQLNGNEFLKTLRNPPAVIFTTAFPEYAIESYELDVVDYLLKPIPFDRFLKAVNKVGEATATSNSKWPEETRSESFVYFRADRKMVKVMLSDIIVVESMRDYVKIKTVQGTIITKQSITSVEAMLPDRQFLRTHRSYIVSLLHIRSYTNELIELDKREIPIGKLYRTGVLRALGAHGAEKTA